MPLRVGRNNALFVEESDFDRSFSDEDDYGYDYDDDYGYNDYDDEMFDDDYWRRAGD